MKSKGLSFGVSLIVMVLAAPQVMAQAAAPQAPQTPARDGVAAGGPGGRNFALPMEAGKAVATVATNTVVASELGLTEAQLALLKAGLDAVKVRQALAVQRLAEEVAEVLTDAQIASDLSLTAAQQLLIKQKMTADLIRKAFTPQQIEELSRAAGAGGMASAAMDSIRQRMMQYDKNGDGQLSEEERRAAFQDFGNRRRGGQGGAQGGGQGGAQGGQPFRRQGDAGGARGTGGNK